MAVIDILHGRVFADVGEDGVIVLEMRDAANRNALSDEFQQAVGGFLARAHRYPQARVVVMCGLPRLFCSGAPRAVLHELADGSFEHLNLMLSRAVLEARVPVIAAMEGDAVGGGFVLGLAADVVVMCESSRYGMNFMDYGYTPGMGATRIMEHVLSPAIAGELLFTGELRRGADFSNRSGINYILPANQVRAKALDVAARIAEKTQASVQMLKAHLSLARRRIHEEARTAEAMMFRICAADPELQARVAANYPAP
jgi:polyketide biosynthesis enoyl-CoA hydratase PksI